MSKIAFFNMPALGHVNPTLDICHDLTRRGHDVLYFCTEDFKAAIEGTGARFFGYRSEEWNKPVEPKPGEFFNRMLSDALSVSPQILKAVAAEKPDMAIYDSMTIWGRTVSRSLKIPAMKIHPTHVMRAETIRGKPGGFSVMFDPGFMKSELEQLAKISNLPAIDFPELWFSPEKSNLVTVPREFQMGGESFGNEYAFIGPSIFNRDAEMPFPMEMLQNKKAVFLSMGTVFNNWSEFFRMCFRAFENNDEYVFVMTTGKRLSVEDIGPVPANFILSSYVPQLKIFPRTAIAFCHGGMNTTMEALNAGVPLVIISQMPEQAITARRISDLGLGLALEKESVSVESLRKALHDVLSNPEIPSRIANMQRAIQNAGGTERAVRVIEAFAKSIRPT